MNYNRNYTLQSLLDELKEDITPFKKGMIFETIKSIYPDSSFNKNKKNIILENRKFTKPLACNKKAKHQFIKENSPIKDFFRENNRGDFLKIIETDGKTAKCINISLKEEIREAFYKDEYITIDINMIIDGYIKQYRRKVNKFFN